ncbi:unnamed protein product [Ectocarpus fasciculatus]
MHLQPTINHCLFSTGHDRVCISTAFHHMYLPFLRIGHGQPVGGTKILADCFEAVLGAVYVDAGGCSDLEPIHAILARVIPSYKHGRRLQEPPQPPHHRHPHPHGAMPPPPRPPAEEPRKLMNLAHRLTQIAKRDADRVQGDGGAAHPMQGDAPGSPPLSRAANGSHRNPLEVVREFDGRLREFQRNVLRGGALSFSSRAFAGAFGEEEARFFAAVATGCPERCALLDSVLDGSSMLRKNFDDAPPGAERVVMEVVPVPSELRLQTFTVVEFLLNNVLQPLGGSAEPAKNNPVLRLIRSAPHGDATISFLSSIVTETATNLLLNAHQRATISAGVALAPLPAPSLYSPPPSNGLPTTASVYMSPPPPGSPMSPLSPPPPPGPGGGRGPPPHLGLPPPRSHLGLPGRKRSSPPHRGGGSWGAAGPRGRGGGWGREGGGGRGRRGGGGITRGRC